MNKTKNKNLSSQRNYGIDLLRLVAAFYVVLLHTMTLGGLYKAITPYSYQDLLCRALMILSFSCVNIFGIISGYVGYCEQPKPHPYSSIFPLWLTVVFYSVIYAGFFMVFFPGQESNAYLIEALLPLTSDLYWYFSCYIFVCLLSPFLNRIIHLSSNEELKQLFFLICCVLIPIEYIADCFEFGCGFTGIWLLLLYMLGGILKKTGIGKNIPWYYLLLAVILIDTCYFFLNLKLGFITVSFIRISFAIDGSLVNPVYAAAAILHVLLFSRFKFSPFWQKWIKFSAAASFSVYIVNTYPPLWERAVVNRFDPWATSSPIGVFVRIMLYTASFVGAVVIIDYLRRELFRLLKVPQWPQKIMKLFRNNC